MIMVTGFLSACADTPDVTFSYYPAKSVTDVTVTQTVGCTKDNKNLIWAHTPSVKTIYSSNFSVKEPLKIRIKGLEGKHADADITMEFFDDGRLKSINQSSTGQGEAIVKSALVLATAVGPLFKGGKPVETDEEACEQIDKWTDKKAVTLIYTAKIDSTEIKPKTIPDLEVTPESQEFYNVLRHKLPKLTLSVEEFEDCQSLPSYNGSFDGESDNFVPLQLQKVGYRIVSIRANYNGKDSTIDSVRIIVPSKETYELPIPKAATFGEQKFKVTLSEAGAVTSISYGKNVGTAGALNALGAITHVETPAEKAADLKAQADLIAQQQRLVRCRADPDKCQ